jgi:hypothetical protein
MVEDSEPPRSLQEVIYTALNTAIASIPSRSSVAERFTKKTHPGLCKTTALLS